MSIDRTHRVVLLRCGSYNPDLVLQKLQQGINMLGGIRAFVKKGEKILLKPNLLAPDPPDTATTTHPEVFRAAAKLLLDFGVDIYCGDSPGFHDPLRALKKSELLPVAENLGIKIADFKSKKKVFFEQGRQNRLFEIAKGVLECEGMISLPKLKTHGFTTMTGAVKNQFGCIPGTTKSGFHAKLEHLDRFSQMLVDLTMFLKPRLYIMDGIVGMEGNGPRRGNTVDLGVLIISSDPVAMDAVASQVIGLRSNQVATTVQGHKSSLGTMDNYEILGDSIE
ncbi:MAG: DUF362 domain-containing protein, partial [Spirochaetota bacterium]